VDLENHDWDVFTVGNLDENEEISYWTGQLEQGEETGRPHWQLYIETHRKITVRTLKMSIGCDWAHVEFVRNREAARDYCRKEETRIAGPYEGGDWVRQYAWFAERFMLQWMNTLMRSAE
jgi:hypothetical protein